jgi:hypothetical protein
MVFWVKYSDYIAGVSGRFSLAEICETKPMVFWIKFADYMARIPDHFSLAEICETKPLRLLRIDGAIWLACIYAHRGWLRAEAVGQEPIAMTTSCVGWVQPTMAASWPSGCTHPARPMARAVTDPAP